MYGLHMRWSLEDDTELRRLVTLGAKDPAIARDLRRTKSSIQARKTKLGLYRMGGQGEPSKTALAHIGAVERRALRAAGDAPQPADPAVEAIVRETERRPLDP